MESLKGNVFEFDPLDYQDYEFTSKASNGTVLHSQIIRLPKSERLIEIVGRGMVRGGVCDVYVRSNADGGALVARFNTPF